MSSCEKKDKIVKDQIISNPGNLIHMDQVESSTPGRPLIHSGKNNKNKICIVLFRHSWIVYLRNYFVSFNTPQVLEKLLFQNIIWIENVNNQPLKFNSLEVIMVFIALLNSEQISKTKTNTSHSVVLVHITKMGLLKNTSEPWWGNLEQLYSMHMKDVPISLRLNYGLLHFVVL